MIKIPFDITCWYINARRIYELVGSRSIPVYPTESDFIQRNRSLSDQKNAAVQYMVLNSVEPLDKLILKNELQVGSLFTHHSNFFFNGLSKVQRALEDEKKGIPKSIGYSKLDQWKQYSRLEFDFHYEHLTSRSSWCELSGQKRKFVFGLVKEITNEKIIVIPYVISNLISRESGAFMPSSYYDYSEIHIDGIDNFSAVINYHPRRSKKDLDALKNIPEQDIKEALAEIINEPQVPKDWGGETSDLSSSYLSINKQRINASFALKGPAKFKPMTMAELGKNGDQISRLYQEPSDLLILQHCHEITNPVRLMMRAFSNQINNLRQYCIIDGYETLRILESYEKCGFKKRRSIGE